MVIYFDDIKCKINPFLALMSSSDSDKAVKAANFLHECASAMLETSIEKHPGGWVEYWQSIKDVARDRLAAG